MPISIICQNKDPLPWLKALKDIDSSLDVRIFPHDANREEIECVLAWSQPEGIFNDYPSLRCIMSMGAGVDKLVEDPSIPCNVAITRIIDSELIDSVVEYVLAAVMSYVRNLQDYYENKQEKLWEQSSYRKIKNVNVGVMGLGYIGCAVTEKLFQIGFKVSGWSRSKKNLNGIKTFHGKEFLEKFLSNSEILICLLPLTSNTRGIINVETLSQLPKGAYFINAARGEHVIEEDLLLMLNSQHISGAFLDVFCEEPLPQKHPFWKHRRIMVTPHIAGLTNPQSVAPQIVDNYRRLKAGKPLINQVDIERGY